MIRIFLFLLVLAVFSSPVWIAALAIGPLPLVLPSPSLSVDDVENAKRLLQENDPRSLRDGERRRVVLSEREINLVLRYLLPEDASARVGVLDSVVSVALSAPVPANPLGSFANAELILLQEGSAFELMALNLGGTSLPAWFARAVIGGLHRLLDVSFAEYRSALDAVKFVQAVPGSIAVTYEWREEVLDQLKDRGRTLAVSDAEAERVLSYYAALVRLESGLRAPSSIAIVLAPLFELAAARSVEEGDPRSEHRALLIALGMAVQGADPGHLKAPGMLPLVRMDSLPVTLRGRRDLAQHFTVSAALAAVGGGAMADAIGVFKELSDSQGGSGFSFPDLLADRAGVVFAEQAMGADARLIQRRLSEAATEDMFMPSIDELPEGLQNLEFRRRYQDLDSETYDRIRNEVEQRIEALPLYRDRP